MNIAILTHFMEKHNVYLLRMSFTYGLPCLTIIFGGFFSKNVKHAKLGKKSGMEKMMFRMSYSG
jgi:hypothetical protein